MKQNEMIIPEWLFQETIEIQNKKRNKPKTFKQIGRDDFELDDKHLKKELAEKMLNPYYFTDSWDSKLT